MTLQNIGVVGMAVMGKNLALNIESKGFSVALYNRTASRTTGVIEENPNKKLLATYSIEEFVNSLEKPRKIILMVQAGQATDATIDSLLPYLEAGDILIDGGNTFYKDTMRRSEFLADSKINFIGAGISGGEEGARFGPSIMPGGQKEAYDLVEPILQEIAAKAEDNNPCVTYIGPDGAGHYVKMVHNGIEYGDMQLIAEAYSIMKLGLGMEANEIGQVFEEWNQGELDSFLIEITAKILQTQDPKTGKAMVDVILDKAGNKGTGKWTSQSALNLGEPLSLITESVFARYISALKEERVAASQIIPALDQSLGLSQEQKAEYIELIRKALYFSKIMSYAQGFSQLKAASDKYEWNLPFGEIAMIWREGCIIRAKFLQEIYQAFKRNPRLNNLMLDGYFLEVTQSNHQAVRQIVADAVQSGIPVATFSAAINYYDSYRSERLSANIIQAQRDYFGAHTYERIDQGGSFHFLWNEGQEEKIE